MSIEYRRGIDPEEFDQFCLAMGVAFGYGTPEKLIEIMRPIAEFDRMAVATEDGRIVGGVTAGSLDLTVPGDRSVAVAALNGVGVLPTHRRRGVNTELMRLQLEETRDRGGSVAILFASEGGIYGRFGYGLGSLTLSMDIEATRTAFVRGYRPSGSVRLIEAAETPAAMRTVLDGAWKQRPGMLRTDERWVTWFLGELDAEMGRDLENEPRFCAVHTDDEGALDGYAIYRVAHAWKSRVHDSELVVEDLNAVAPEAEAALWRYLFDVDLIARVTCGNRPADDPLLHLLAEPRRLRATLADGLWVRLVDVPAALAARGYAADGRVVVEVEDRFCPWNAGRYELIAEGGAATCERTEAEPDLAAGVNDLGAVYLGATTFAALRRSLQVRELTEGALRRADAMFASEPAPWCQLPF